ncbi:MAG TPA: class I SAM-dependent methyltransferase [Steroidobacteraceae bacterium]|jgi:SAM-dependent methyltransferase
MTDQEAYREQYDTLWRDLWANTHAGGPMARTRYRLALRWLSLVPESSARTLDVGAGNGAFMLQALNRSPRLEIYGAEYSQAAIDLAHPAIKDRLARCDLQGTQPLPWGGGFQLISCMEVLEHMPDDALALEHIARALSPGGRLFVSVPAWQSLWGPQDVAAGHVRRYEPTVLRERMERTGLRIRRMKCWGGPFARIYLRAADMIGPEKVMSVRPSGIAGLAAGAIYQFLKLDDALSFGRGPQLLALAEKPS